MWLLTGHCGYSLSCDRWATGCGTCPDLRLDPAIHRDATDRNLARKRRIYLSCRLHVATPSRWLLDLVRRSALMPAVREVKVIPNGVDLSVFRPGDRAAARAALGLPQDGFVVLATAGSRNSMWKNGPMMSRVIERLASAWTDGLATVILLGGRPGRTRVDRVHVVSMPYQSAASMVACYRAADVYAHASRADNHPLSVLEALACGTPVVATGVGGVPEQIRSAGVGAVSSGSGGALEDATGVLVRPDDADGMAAAIGALRTNTPVREAMTRNAVRDAERRFSLTGQVDAYLDWYRSLLAADAPRDEPGGVIGDV